MSAQQPKLVWCVFVINVEVYMMAKTCDLVLRLSLHGPAIYRTAISGHAHEVI